MELLAYVCLIAIVVCLAIAVWAGLARRYWLGMFALASIVAIALIFFTAQTVGQINSVIRLREEARPIYVPFQDELSAD